MFYLTHKRTRLTLSPQHARFGELGFASPYKLNHLYISSYLPTIKSKIQRSGAAEPLFRVMLHFVSLK